MHFVSSFTRERFRQVKLRYILCPRFHGMGLVNTSWDAFCVLAGIGGVWSTHIEMHFVSSLSWEGYGQHKLRCILCPLWHRMRLVDTFWDIFYFLAGLGGVWATQVEIHFVFSMTLISLVNTSWDIFSVLAGIGGFFSTQVYFVLSLAWDGFGEHMLRYIFFIAGMGGFGQHMLSCIFCSRWPGMGWLVKTCWNTFCVLAG